MLVSKTPLQALKVLRTYLVIAFGLFLNALGWTAFLIPTGITGGGITGASTILYFATGFPVGISYLIINVFLILLAIRVLGASFGLKTILAVVILSLFLGGLQRLIHEPFVSDAFMASVIGGILAGAGVGIVFTQGGSTGGTDIIAMIINKYRNISPGRIILYIDILIISSSFLVFRSIEKMVFGYVTMAITVYVIDLVLSGSKQSFQVFIFSQKYEEIAERIASELNRGITILDGQGWYTKQNTRIILVLIRKHETSHLLRIIKEIDPSAFMSMNSAMGVYGQGFEKIRP
jgi:uncharacterized membrane-anchored protein YitT (DUF2179 family)